MFRSISSSMHAGATTPTEPLDAVAILSNGNGLPQKPDGSASASSLFEACSAFTHVPACMVAKSPKVTRYQSTSTHSLPPAPLWLLPAERLIGRMGFAPTGDRRLSRHTGFMACLTRHGLLTQTLVHLLSKLLGWGRPKQVGNQCSAASGDATSARSNPPSDCIIAVRYALLTDSRLPNGLISRNSTPWIVIRS